LPQITGCRRVLLLGDGDGRFLEQLLLANPACNALAVDSSAAMLERLRRRCLANPALSAAGRVETLEADALDISPSPETDLIVTHFVLDCFSQPDLERLVHTLAAPLAPGTLWLVSDFDLPPQAVPRLLARAYIRALYLVFRALTGLRVRRLPDSQRVLASAGFQRIHRWQILGGFLYSDLWRLDWRPE
jgi:ubiquinone/menaquinone biosynthesis C-methylase UbiE